MSVPVWMPHAGHFIGGMSCSFHLNTWVNGYIISTVGEYRPSASKEDGRLRLAPGGGILARRDAEPPEQIGLGRLYETMVFRARLTRWKEEAAETDRCCLYEMASGENLDFASYNHPGDAYRGHLVMMDKWAEAAPGDEVIQ